MDNKEYISLLKTLTSLLEKDYKEEVSFLKDNGNRLIGLHVLTKRCDRIISEFKRVVRLELDFLDKGLNELMTRNLSAKNELKDHAKSAIKQAKVAFHLLIDLENEDKEVEEALEEYKEKLNKFVDIETEDYSGMLSILQNYFETLGPLPEEEENKRREEIEKIRLILDKNIANIRSIRDIKKIDSILKEIFEEYRTRIIPDQKAYVNEILNSLKVFESIPLKEVSKKGGRVTQNNKHNQLVPLEEYSAAKNSLETSLIKLKEALLAEKNDVFDVFNEFMKKKRDLETFLMRFIEELEEGKDALGRDDVEKFFALMSSQVDANRLDRLKTEMENLRMFFDKDAIEFIKEVLDTQLLSGAKEADKRSIIAYVDVLTGLPNATAYKDAIEEINEKIERRRLAKKPSLPVSVFSFDLDYFKTVNDVYGHQAGDDTLRKFASIVKGSLRRTGTDVLYRKGGEEFALVVVHENFANILDSDVNKLANVKKIEWNIAERIRTVVSKTDFRFKVSNEKNRVDFWKEGKLRIVGFAGNDLNKVFQYDKTKDKTCVYDRETEKELPESEWIKGLSMYSATKKNRKETVWITISGGVANYPIHTNSVFKVFDIADLAMYNSKNNGRNRVGFATQTK